MVKRKEGADVFIERVSDTDVYTNVPYVWHSHSQTFNFGYGGSGPADFALNILLMFLEDRDLAWALHQDFKWKFVAPMPEAGGRITKEEINAWLDEQLARREA